VAIDPSNGDEIFQFAFGERGPTVNAATPLVFGDKLFVSSSYGVGARLARISRTEAVIEWNNDESMSSQYNTCVYSDGFLYGTHGREDQQPRELRCVEAETGEVRWSAPQVGVAHVLLNNDQLLILNTEGRLILAPATAEGFQPLADAVLTDRLTRALPAFSEGRLYLRDTANLHCFELAK
jgi:outer membrane protein assembly factor BamB